MDIPEKSLERIDIVIRTLRYKLIKKIAQDQKWDERELLIKFMNDDEYIEVKEKISRSPK